MSQIEIVDIRKSYDETEIVKGINFQIDEGEFAVVVGPSGCGKSTLLRMIAGLEDITSGELKIGGEVVNHVAPDKRGIAMVFQSYALYPHMSVAENIGFALSLQKVDKAEIAERVKEAAHMLQLEHLLARKPAELSGGQRQRVAIGRAIVKRPKVILFDEPLSNLDAKLRVQMRAELTRLHKEFGSTIVYVTHDQVEAMTMAEKIVVLNAGHVAQLGKPMELYNQPENTFVAEFIGVPKMNLLQGNLQGSQFLTEKGQSIELGRDIGNASDIQLGIRPEHISLSLGADSHSWEVGIVERLGAETFVHLQNPTGEEVIVRMEGDQDYASGTRVQLAVTADHCHFFDGSGQRLEDLNAEPAAEVQTS